MIQDSNVHCFSGLHLGFLLLLGIPGIIIFAIGVPLGAAIFLRVKRKHLESAHFSAKYGFIYEGECGVRLYLPR